MYKTIIKTCEECHNDFKANRPARKFCSRRCWGSSYTKRSKTEKKCKNCGTNFKTLKWKDYKFCSRKCYLAYGEKAPQIKHPECLEVISFSHRIPKIKMSYWNTKCKICGQIKPMGLNSLRVSKSCGCSANNRGNKSKGWKGAGDFSSTFFSEIKKQALRRKLEFNLTLEYLWNLYVEQNKKCALSGLEISFGETIYKTKYRINRINNTVSLDRINSGKGYIEGNVQWVHKDLNFMKQVFSQQHFINMCKLVAEKHK